MSSTDEKMIILKSSNGETFEVKENVAMASQTLRHMIEDVGAGDAIPVPMVSPEILGKVIEYLNRHAGAGEDLKAFDDEFVKVDQQTLFDLVMAANYLEIKGLLELTCQTVADMIKGKTPEQIRTIFNIKNDFTPEEEEQIRRENAWAFE